MEERERDIKIGVITMLRYMPRTKRKRHHLGRD